MTTSGKGELTGQIFEYQSYDIQITSKDKSSINMNLIAL